MPRTSPPATPRQPSPKHISLVLSAFALATGFCVAVGLGMKPPQRSLQVILLSVGAGVAAVCAIWLIRHSLHTQTANQATDELPKTPIRFTKAKAALYSVGSSTFFLLFAFYTIAQFSFKKDPLEKLASALFGTFCLSFLLPKIIFFARPFLKAWHEGTLVITAPHLPPKEKLNLQLFGVISNLDHAVPAAEVVRSNVLDKAYQPQTTLPNQLQHPPHVIHEHDNQQLTSTHL